MHPTTFRRGRFSAALAALAGLLATTTAVAQPPQPPIATPPPALQADVKVDAKTGALLVPLGGVVRFQPDAKKPIRDVINRNEDVVDIRVDVRSPSTLVMVGRRAGASKLTITVGGRDDEQKLSYDVVVQADFELLKTVIRRAVPAANVDVVPGVGSAIILTGFVTKPEDADTIVRIASDATGGQLTNLINAIQIGGSQHVLIDLTVAQVDRTELRQRGVNFGVQGPNFSFASTIGGLSTATNLTNQFGAGVLAPPITPGVNSNIVFGIIPAQFAAALQALRSEGLAKFLSEPKLVTQSGRPAFFRAGGQQAVLGPASGINGPGVILQPVGTEMEVLPIVFGNGKIYVEINPRITSVNNGRGITTAFGFTPGFNETQVRSSVMMEPGQTFAIGGLLETQVQASNQKVPFLGDLPIFGAAWSTVSYQDVESELLIMVTPRMAEAMDCAQVPHRVPTKETRGPDDYELFLETLLEAPRGQRKVWNGKCYNAAYKCDPTYGVFPCENNVCPGGAAGAGCKTGGCATGGCATTSPILPAAASTAAPTELPVSVPAAVAAP